jgi:hypothetical protein
MQSKHCYYREQATDIAAEAWIIGTTRTPHVLLMVLSLIRANMEVCAGGNWTFWHITHSLRNQPVNGKFRDWLRFVLREDPEPGQGSRVPRSPPDEATPSNYEKTKKKSKQNATLHWSIQESKIFQFLSILSVSSSSCVFLSGLFLGFPWLNLGLFRSFSGCEKWEKWPR